MGTSLAYLVLAAISFFYGAVAKQFYPGDQKSCEDLFKYRQNSGKVFTMHFLKNEMLSPVLQW